MSLPKEKRQEKRTDVSENKGQDKVMLQDSSDDNDSKEHPQELWGDLRFEMDCQDVSKMP